MSKPKTPAASWRGFCDLEHRNVLQQRKDADDDYDETGYLFCPAINRQHANEIENQHNHQEGDQDADEN